MNTPEVSVIIPTRNGERSIEKLLKAVFAQKTCFVFEVIIVDSGSTDRTKEIALSYPVQFYQIKPEDFNHGLTRNLGIKYSRGEYVALLTQDAIPYNLLWLEKLIRPLKDNPLIAGVYSRQIAGDNRSLIDLAIMKNTISSLPERNEIIIEDIGSYGRLLPEDKRRLCNFDNVSSCIRKRVWETIPFPKTEFAEDIEWAQQVLILGFKIAFEPESVVYHLHKYSVLEWFKRNQIDAERLEIIFGPAKKNNCLNILLAGFRNSIRYISFSVKNGKDIVSILNASCLALVFAFAGAFGRYIGTRNLRARGKKDEVALYCS